MKKITVMTIVGTRPEIIKLSEVMKELDKHTNHIIVHTGQNYDYELNELFFEQLNVRTPDYFLEAVKGTVSETIGDIIAKADKIQFVNGLPKTRSGKIMRRILRKIAAGEGDNLGDISTLLDPTVVEGIKIAAQ